MLFFYCTQQKRCILHHRFFLSILFLLHFYNIIEWIMRAVRWYTVSVYYYCSYSYSNYLLINFKKKSSTNINSALYDSTVKIT